MQISNFEKCKNVEKACVTQMYPRRGFGGEAPAAGGFGGLGAPPPAVERLFVIF